MPGIGGLGERIAARGDLEAPTERDEDALAQVERQGSPAASLEEADRGLGDPDASPELVLGKPHPAASGADLTTESGELLLVAPPGLGRQLDTPGSGHIEPMIAACACLAIGAAEASIAGG